MRIRSGLGLLAALALVASDVEAQAVSNSFRVTPRASYVSFDRASSLKSAPMVNIGAEYMFNSMFSAGFNFGAGRAETRGEDFITTLTFNNATFVQQIRQPVTLIDVAATATAKIPLAGRVAPYVTGGVGAYTMYLDPQVSGGSRNFSRMSAQVGGGLMMSFSERSSVSLDVRDLILTKYRRDRLGPVTSSNVLFAEDLPMPPEAKETLHNIVFSLGFGFVPGGARTTGNGGDEDNN